MKKDLFAVSDLVTVACFYVQFAGSGTSPHGYYHAVYLTERTVRNLERKICEKQQIDPRSIVRIVRVNQNGLRIMVDDNVVRQLLEGQDMLADIIDTSGQDGTVLSADSSAVEIKLIY